MCPSAPLPFLHNVVRLRLLPPPPQTWEDGTALQALASRRAALGAAREEVLVAQRVRGEGQGESVGVGV